MQAHGDGSRGWDQQEPVAEPAWSSARPHVELVQNATELCAGPRPYSAATIKSVCSAAASKVTRIGMDLAAGVLLPTALCQIGSNGLHSG